MALSLELFGNYTSWGELVFGVVPWQKIVAEKLSVGDLVDELAKRCEPALSDAQRKDLRVKVQEVIKHRQGNATAETSEAESNYPMVRNYDISLTVYHMKG